MTVALDRYNRVILNIRISVTSKCNLNCIFCHKEGNDAIRDVLTPKAIQEVVKVVTSYGVRKVKITGGEPLIRRDIVEIVNRIASVQGIQEVSMVTNASLLEPLAEPLKRAGLNRVNINLPSLNRNKYYEVTKGKLESTLKGVRSAVKYELKPVKINMVLLKGINDNELEDYINFASREGVHVQVIELEPIRIKSEYYDKMHMDPNRIERLLKKRSIRSWIRESMHKRKVYDLGNINVEVVHPIDNTEFCSFCNRIRLTNDGAFKPCLMENFNKVYINNGLTKEDSVKISKAYLQSVMNRKPYFRSY